MQLYRTLLLVGLLGVPLVVSRAAWAQAPRDGRGHGGRPRGARPGGQPGFASHAG